MAMPASPPVAEGTVARPWVVVWALAVTQLISWGTLYYGFAVLVGPMQAELEWSRATLNGALSLGLIVAGLTAFSVGRRIDRRGGRAVMTLGSLVAALLCIAWSQVQSPLVFYALWAALGAVLAAVLYDPAFAVLTAVFRGQAVRSIAVLTLVGGFASTLFIPLIHYLVDFMGWRDALLVIAGLHLFICVPLHAWFLPGTTASAGPRPVSDRSAAMDRSNASNPADSPDAPDPSAAPNASAAAPTIRTLLTNPVFLGLALWFAAHTATSSALTFQLIPFLTDQAVPAGHVVLTMTLIGPMQVLGRAVVMLIGQRADTRRIGGTVIGLVSGALILLLVAPTGFPWLGIFAALYGAGHGIMTILRGAAVAELIGSTNFGAVNGALALPVMLGQAGAPFAAATLWSATGSPHMMMQAVLALSLLSGVGFILAVASARRRVSISHTVPQSAPHDRV